MNLTEGKIIQFKELSKGKVVTDKYFITSLEEAIKYFLLNCKVKNLSPKTISWYETRLKYFVLYLKENNLEISEVTIECLRDFVRSVQEKPHFYYKEKKLSTYSVKGIVFTLKLFFKFLKEEGFIEHNPAERIAIPKVQKKIIKPFSLEQIESLLAIPNHKTFTGFRNYLIILILLDTGIRLSELLNIKWQDVQWETNTLFVLGKGNKERQVPFGVKVAKTLIKYLKWRGKIEKQDFLFVDTYGIKIKSRRVQKILQDYGKKANIENVRVSPHTLRHSFAYHWIKNGGDPFTLQQILGHTSLEMVKNYVAIANGDMVNQHFKFGVLNKMESRKYP